MFDSCILGIYLYDSNIELLIHALIHVFAKNIFFEGDLVQKLLTSSSLSRVAVNMPTNQYGQLHIMRLPQKTDAQKKKQTTLIEFSA